MGLEKGALLVSVLLKDPSAPIVHLMSFGAAAASVVSVEIAPQGYVPGGAALVAATIVVSGLVQLTFTGGADGELYNVTGRAGLVGGDEGERDISVMSVTRDWQMPGGTVTGWISLHEFIERFGLDETISATAVDAGGVLDRAFLVAKLQDAQAEAEANVAARYALPLAQVPAILKKFRRPRRSSGACLSGFQPAACLCLCPPGRPQRKRKSEFLQADGVATVPILTIWRGINGARRDHY
jgi:Protein of unknown function (DUF1320)